MRHALDVEGFVELLLGQLAALDEAELITVSRMVAPSASACFAILAAAS